MKTFKDEQQQVSRWQKGQGMLYAGGMVCAKALQKTQDGTCRKQ